MCTICENGALWAIGAMRRDVEVIALVVRRIREKTHIGRWYSPRLQGDTIGLGL